MLIHLKYLQKNNTDAGNSYPQEWLQLQATDFKNAMLYAQEQIATVADSNTNEEGRIAKLIQEIHLRCSSELYRIGKNAAYSDEVKKEESGILRKCETINLKNVPVLDCKNTADLNYLRLGNIPKLIDGRLQRIKIDPSKLSSAQKEQAMHGQPAWLAANDVIQIVAYIETHLGKQESYYFLCAYYKDNYLRTKRSDPKIMMFSNYLMKEIEKLSTELKLTFNKNTTILTPEEQRASERVYVVHPAPEKIADQFSAYTRDLALKIREIEKQNPDKVAHFCVDAIIHFMSMHPFYNANYRTISIFINAILSHFGYEHIDFTNKELKKSFNIPFNNSIPNKDAAVSALSSCLVKRIDSSNNNTTVTSLSKQDELLQAYKSLSVDQAIRRTAATGKNEDLAFLLKQNPQMVDVADQTPGKGLTALHWAVKNKDPNCITTLLSFGARCDIPDKMGQTAMDYAKGDESLISLLSGKASESINNKGNISGYNLFKK